MKDKHPGISEAETLQKYADNINHPAHYMGKIECIEAIEAQVDDFTSYLHGNIVKYVWRFRKKGGTEDLKKARWYLERLIEEMET